MEDGNNFGVTVQMTVSKHLSDTRVSLLKKMDALVSYYSSRADAVDKLSLEKKTFTTSAASSKTESTKEEDKKESSSSSSDEKIVKVEKVIPGVSVLGFKLPLNLLNNSRYRALEL